MLRRALVGAVCLLTVSASLAPSLAADPVAALPSLFQAAPACAALATDPANGLAGNASVKSAASHIVAATGPNKSFCQVDLVYGINAQQNIAIRVGLPLSVADGGAGGVQGAWNGRTQGIGGGGCSGGLGINAPVNAGYVGSGSDAGHAGGNCDPGVNADGTYNLQFINDFIRNGMKQQVLFSKALALRYYGTKPSYNYWNGCSTGGRQGYVLAQELGDELDGILASAPAIYWTRFQTAQMWGQVVMKDLTGGPIAAAKLNAATAAAVAACDAADGVTDGVLDDPRTCTFSAKALVCGTSTAPAANCLTPQEADAIDKIWDGPRNKNGDRVWFGSDRGTQISALNGAMPFALGATQFHWDEHDLTFDWHTVTMATFADVFQAGSNNIADVTDTIGTFDAFKAHGGKVLTMVGGNDQLIFPRGVINYYRQMTSHENGGMAPDFAKLQQYYRLFRAPGNGHCGGGNAPQAQDLFGALTNWVEKGQAPATILSTMTANGAVTRSRPLCAYPQTAIYNGTGSTDDAASFHCGGNLETQALVCDSLLVTYKHEADGALDYAGSGLAPGSCRRSSQK